ncbi:hypothetical protein TWF730_000635 [Orbilia blumenaviensis]|uniref:Uncharacterized protein n=1 Tax=Orbilia blumenaviensis TaxID=1796055 RepID=A0AAV9VQA0_9PEZI
MGHPTITWKRKTCSGEKYVTTMGRTTNPIPDLKFSNDMLLVDKYEQTVVARLLIVGRPTREFLEFMVTRERVDFAEHVPYRVSWLDK